MTIYDISIIIPSIRVNNLPSIYLMLEKAIEPYNFEMIIVGPTTIPDVLWNRENVRFVKDFGSPSRCVQIGAAIAEGHYMCWLSDDCTYLAPQSLYKCIEMFNSNQISQKDGITLRYFEGEGNNEFPLDYWRARHHADMHLFGVKESYKIAPLGIYNTDYFKEIGGLDCIFEHINMCTHDLAFRVQNNGGQIHMSPDTVARFYWSWHGEDAKPVQEAYFENDKSAFQNMYNKDQSDRINLNYSNWMYVDSKWKRRFKK